MRITAAIVSVILCYGTTCNRIATADISVTGQATLKLDVMAPAKTSGAITKMKVDEGDVVAAGQVLATIDDGIARGEFAAASHDARVFEMQKDNDVALRLSQKTRAVSQRELERSYMANKRYNDAVSATELERLQLLVEQAKLSEEKAKLDLRVAGANHDLKKTIAATANEKLNLHQITSPIDGMVVAIESRAGEWVDAGMPVLRIIKLDLLRVEADIDGTRYGPEILGTEVTFESKTKGKTQTHKGKVVFVSPEMNAVDESIRIWADIDTPRRKLKPGMRGTLTIPLAGSDKEPSTTGR